MTPKSLIAPARLARRPVLATQSDGRLVDLVRAGNDSAFEAIVARYRAPLLRYVERFLPRERAEDAVQQSFVKAYEAMLRGGAELQLRPWLYRIAHNTALNVLRDRTLRHSELSETIDGVERPDEALERSLGLREALAAVQALPERQRDAIVLRELEGRTYDEIAAQLGVSDGSVRQLLHRARSALRAGATAVTPAGLLARLPWESELPIAARVAELCGAGAGGAVVAKACATVLVTGAVVGGVAVTPRSDDGDRAVGPEKAAASKPAPRGGDGGSGDAGVQLTHGSGISGEGESGEGGSRDDDGSRSGSGGGDRGDRSGSSGSGSDDSGGESDSSGPGSGDAHEVDNSGSGSSGSGSDGSDSDNSGSGSGSSGSGSGSSGSGSSGSGSGSSGSGSGSSGSGSGSSGSGSGSSGSGSDSSGPGSGTLEPLDPVELDTSGSGSDSSGSGSDSSGSGSGSSGSGSSGSD